FACFVVLDRLLTSFERPENLYGRGRSIRPSFVPTLEDCFARPERHRDFVCSRSRIAGGWSNRFLRLSARSARSAQGRRHGKSQLGGGGRSSPGPPGGHHRRKRRVGGPAGGVAPPPGVFHGHPESEPPSRLSPGGGGGDRPVR